MSNMRAAFDAKICDCGEWEHSAWSTHRSCVRCSGLYCVKCLITNKTIGSFGNYSTAKMKEISDDDDRWSDTWQPLKCAYCGKMAQLSNTEREALDDEDYHGRKQTAERAAERKERDDERQAKASEQKNKAQAKTHERDAAAYKAVVETFSAKSQSVLISQEIDDYTSLISLKSRLEIIDDIGLTAGGKLKLLEGLSAISEIRAGYETDPDDY